MTKPLADGRIVHYGPGCQSSVVTAVVDEATVDLVVIDGETYHKAVPHDGDDRRDGTWHRPETPDPNEGARPRLAFDDGNHPVS